jgi:hypothetical protein
MPSQATAKPKKTLLKLNRENYHSIEADQDYLSVSQFKSFLSCEAATVAHLSGDYVRPDTNALTVGSYVHTAFEGAEAHQKFIEENSDSIFKKRGGKYSDFELADQMIKAINRQKLAMFALDGEPEQIFKVHLFGTDWKIRTDVINHQTHRFADIKTCQDIHKRFWDDKYDGWCSFVEHWGYVLQMAVYRRALKEITGEDYTPYIVAVSKESPPNVAVINFDTSRFEFELKYVQDHIERILKLKAGEEEPIECGKCDYCRRAKTISKVIEVGQLIY